MDTDAKMGPSNINKIARIIATELGIPIIYVLVLTISHTKPYPL